MRKILSCYISAWDLTLQESEGKQFKPIKGWWFHSADKSLYSCLIQSYSATHILLFLGFGQVHMSGTIWTTDWYTWEIKLDHKTAQGLLTPSLDLAVHLETIYCSSFTSEHAPLSEEEPWLVQTCRETGTTCRVMLEKTNRAASNHSLILSYTAVSDEDLLQSTGIFLLNSLDFSKICCI